MGICNCWEWLGSGKEGECLGTKEIEYCTCGGDTSKCDFYAEKRKEDRYMNTVEMYLQAQRDGKTYRSKDMRYNVREGFCDEDGTPWEGYAFKFVNDIFNLNEWELVPDNEMTREEAEKKFNIKIID